MGSYLRDRWKPINCRWPDPREGKYNRMDAQDSLGANEKTEKYLWEEQASG